MVRFESLDLNLLRTFEVIYSERNLSRAALVLNVSQPAVSNALQRLRDALGDPLFVREGRGMRPTSVADTLAPLVNSALDTLRAGLSMRQGFDPLVSRRSFHVSMNDPAEALFLKPLVEHLLCVAPRISLFCRFIGRHDLAHEMATGTLDLAVDVPTDVDARLRHAELTEEHYTGIVRHGHRFAGAVPTIDEYLAADHIHVSARRRGLGHIERRLADIGLKRHVAVRMRNVGIAADIVRKTDLVMTMPERVAAYYDLAHFPLPFAVPGLSWQLYWPSRLERDPANRWLRDQVLGIAARVAH